MSHKLTFLVALPLILALAGCDPADDDTADDDDTTEGDDDTTADDDDTTADDDDTTTDDDDDDGGVRYGYFAVHLDPGSSPVDPVEGGPNASRPMAYLQDLTDLVDAADLGGHKLTLMFTGQWAHHVQQPGCQIPDDGNDDLEYEYQGVGYVTCLEVIQAFEAYGHEIALHHHPFDAPAAWDGYTDLESWQADRDFDGVEETYFADGGGPSGPDPNYLGTTEDLLALITPIATSGVVVSASTEEYPGGVIHSAAGGPEDYVGPGEPGDLLGQPCTCDFDGHWVWQLRMRSYTSTGTQDEVRDEELPVAVADYEGSADGDWSTAFVTHAINVDETGVGQYELLFNQLDSLGITLETLADVMGHYGYTATPPDQADAAYVCGEP